MLVFIDPKTGKSSFEADDIKFMTTVEKTDDNVYQFEIVLENGNIIPFTFDNEYDAVMRHTEIFSYIREK